jgi:hypothetical protein
MIATAITLHDLDKRRPLVLAELHPELRAKVDAIVVDLGGRLTPYCGYRDAAAQAKAFADGASAARFGESPHNFKPALACDLVLDPRHVPVKTTIVAGTEWPNLWDEETPEALAAWEALERAAFAAGLERVNVGGRRDRPHVQLANWRGLILS